MKRFLLVAFIALSAAVVAHAQNNTPTAPRTQAGNNALLFSINGLGDFNLGSAFVTSVPLTGTPFDSADSFFDAFGIQLGRPLFGLGFKTFLSNNLALRGALSFTSSTKTTPLGNDTTGKEDKRSSLGFGIGPAIEVHLVNSGPVTVYTGAGISYGMFTTTTTRADTTIGESSNTSSTFAAGALLGGEFFPWSNISLGAEYQLLFATSSSSSETKGKETTGPSLTNLGIGSFAVTLGVHF